MDVKLVRQLITEKILEEIKSYLNVFDVSQIEGLPPTELLKRMVTAPRPEYLDEYSTARKILEYNQSAGTLTGYNCPKCLNRGNFLDIDDYGNEFLKSCSCQTTRAVIRNAEKSGLGDLLEKRFSSFQSCEAWQKGLLNAVKHYALNGGQHWLCIAGQSGAGKTHLCCAAANQMLKNGHEVVYMVWTKEIRRLKQLATDTAYEKEFDRFRIAEVLYIDDLFKGKITDADITAAFDLINYRYNHPKLITIISSELFLEEIRAIDSAIAGRIKERCGSYVFRIERDENRNHRFSPES